MSSVDIYVGLVSKKNICVSSVVEEIVDMKKIASVLPPFVPRGT